MQIISAEDNLHEVPSPILWENYRQLGVCWFCPETAVVEPFWVFNRWQIIDFLDGF